MKGQKNVHIFAICWSLTGIKTSLHYFHLVEEVICKNQLRIGFRNEPRVMPPLKIKTVAQALAQTLAQTQAKSLARTLVQTLAQIQAQTLARTLVQTLA